ncbi:MAG TPA: hypothetical protein VF867_01170 [Arthrobacter sp.]
MKRTLTVIGTAALLCSSLLLGAGPANAGTCPAGQHWNDMGGGAGFCSPDASGGGTGGSVTIDLGGAPPAGTGSPPVYQAPVGSAPVRGAAPQIPAQMPVYVPAAPPANSPAPAAPRAPSDVPASTGWQAPSGNAAPWSSPAQLGQQTAFSVADAPGSNDPAGETLQSMTPVGVAPAVVTLIT